MAKRKAQPSENRQLEPLRKKQKPDAEIEAVGLPAVNDARQLRALLGFSQDNPTQLRAGVQQFKEFLETIVYPKDVEIVPRQRAILREYLDSVKPKEGEDGLYLTGLFQAWGFSSSTNNDALFSVIASVLALLVKALSSHIDFRDYGRGICKGILGQDHLKLIAKGLSREKSKAYIVSPCLRLLTEIVSLDGGGLARQVYQNRDYTFDTKALTRNLHWREQRDDNADQKKRKPTVRSNAIRYLLANFRFQSRTEKIDILKQGNVVKALFEGLESDPTPLVLEVISYLKTYIVEDKFLPRSRKSYVFNDDNLHSLYKLFRSHFTEESSINGADSPMAQISGFIHVLCTNPEAGVLRYSKGWYPPGSDQKLTLDAEDGDVDDRADCNLETLKLHDKGEGRIPIRNIALASFAQLLRPYANNSERSMLTEIFKAAPELVADYFFKKKSFSFVPKLTATWVGYASVLFETVQLPIPTFFGQRDAYTNVPPPPSIVIENIMPQPLNQQVLSKCVNGNSALIRLFAFRILALALKKLQEVLKQIEDAAEGRSQLWKTAASELRSEFTRRCPRMRDIILAFRKLSNEDVIQREAATRVLALYYDVLPQVALDERFDITVTLNRTLQEIEQTGRDDSKGMQLIELDHLVHVSLWCQQDISWGKRHQGLVYTPFVTLLKLAATVKGEASLEVKRVLEAVVRETNIVQLETLPTALDALTASLKRCEGNQLSIVLGFVDDCFQRFLPRRITYEDQKDVLCKTTNEEGQQSAPFSLLLMTILEQWPHRQKQALAVSKQLAEWISLFHDLLEHIGEDKSSLSAWTAAMEATTIDEIRPHLLSVVDTPELDRLLPTQQAGQPSIKATTAEVSGAAADLASTQPTFDITALCPSAEDPKHPALSRFPRASTDLHSYVQDGALSPLLLYLSSADMSIRRQTLLLLKQLCTKLRNSSDTEAPMLHLLIGELVETYEQHQLFRPSSDQDSQRNSSGDRPLPYLATTFATHALPVLADPTSALYPKLCTFLCRRPSWNPPAALLTTLLTQILYHPPSDADSDASSYRELTWLLDWLFDGTRTPADVDILRRCAAIDRLAALFNHESLARFRRLDLEPDPEGPAARARAGGLQAQVRTAIVRLVARTALVDGGATTLVTRAGVLAWLDGVTALRLVDERGTEMLRALREELLKRVGRERVAEWSLGMIGRNEGGLEGTGAGSG